MKAFKGLLTLAIAVGAIAFPAEAACPLSDPASCIYVDIQNCVDPGIGTQADPFCSIQDGIDVAFPGDTLLVLPGTYAECVANVGPGKPIHMVADAFLEDPTNPASRELTVLDGTAVCDGTIVDPDTGFTVLTPTVLFGANDTLLTRIEGFTITGGGVSGVAVRGGVTVTNNIIRGNESVLGGGAYVYTASCDYPGPVSTVISNNLIEDNLAKAPADDIDLIASGDGGGLYVLATGTESDVSCFSGTVDVTITGNTIRNNQIQNDNIDPGSGAQFSAFGAGMVVNTDSDQTATASVSITQNTISGNGPVSGSLTYGGGLWALTYGFGIENITISENTVTGNTSSGDGGGLSAWSNSFVLATHTIDVSDNAIANNTAIGNGGGIDAFVFADDLAGGQQVTLSATDNTVAGNSSAGFFGGGGGVLATLFSDRTQSSEVTFLVEGNEIRDNTAEVSGGGAAMVIVADADPDSTFDPPVCAVALPASSEINFRSNLVVDNAVIGISDPLEGDPTPAGGGVFVFTQAFGQATATADIQNSTVAGNSSISATGGIEIESVTDLDCPVAFEGESIVRIANSIVADNAGFGIGGPSAGFRGVLTQGLGTYNLTMDLTSTNVFGNSSGDYEPNPDPDVDFDNPGGSNLSVDPGFENDLIGDYHLAFDSPMIDAGFSAPVTATDYEGDPRLVGPEVDLGADEFYDTDGDGVQNQADNCPDDANTSQADADNDLIGDACDPCTDVDGDGWGLAGSTTCTFGADDCDDTSSDTYPGAPEICDGEDNDCMGGVDDLLCGDFDVDGDATVGGAELAWLGRAFGLSSATPLSEWWYDVDYNQDGMVDGDDLARLAVSWNCSGASTNVCP